MKILFMGADIFASPILETLIAEYDFTITMVVTRPAKPAGRGLRPQPNPILSFAKKNNLPTILIDNVDDWALVEKEIISSKPDFVLTAALGKIIPENILDLMPQNFINVHPSLLPNFRGPAPVEEAILSGENTTGVSIMIMASKMDAGPLLARYRLRFSDITADVLSQKLSRLAAKKLPSILIKYQGVKIKPTPQNEQQATYTHIITKKDGDISSDDASVIYRKFLAYYPWPGIFFTSAGKQIKIIDCELSDDKKTLLINSLRVAGKNTISAREFSNGYRNLLTKFPKNVKLNLL